MKNLFVSLLSVIVLLSVSSCAVYSKTQEKAPFMTQTFSASAINAVESSTSGGSLTLTGDAGSKATVEVYVSRDNWSDEKIKQVLDDNYTLDIKVVNGKLCAVAKQKKSFSNWNNNQGLSISFKISVPKQVDSDLKTSGGSIQISNLAGSQNFKTSGGSLTTDNVTGSISGATSGGSISVTNSKGNIDMATSGGSITAKNCNGAINLATSGGSLNLSNLSGNINAATSGGSITANNINGTFTTATSGGSVNLDDIAGNLDAKTSGGNMNVRIISAKDYVKLSNSGNLNLRLPAGKDYNLTVKANNIETSGLQDFRGDSNSRSIEGTTGNGGTEINVKSSQRVRLVFE